MGGAPSSMWTRTAAGLALAGLASCSSISAVFDRGPETSLDQVDDLLGQVERTHMECELSRQVCLDLLEALHVLAAPEFRGDAIAAHQALLERLESSRDQAETLAAGLEPLAASAGAVMERWQTDLDAFVSPTMRERSAERLSATNALYAEVHRSLEAAVEFYELYNLGLSDHALYLGNDLNMASVDAIEGELLVVTELAAELDARLLKCMDACQGYVAATALRGQLAVPRIDDGARVDDLAVVQVAPAQGLRLAAQR